jgi:hypothetical protein
VIGPIRFFLMVLAATVLPVSHVAAQTKMPSPGTLRAHKLGAEHCKSGCSIICATQETIASAVCIADAPMVPHVGFTSDGEATFARCGPSKGMTVICVFN